MKHILPVLILSIVLSACGTAENNPYTEFKAFQVNQKDSFTSGTKGYIAIKAEIPGKYHIYGNPKGHGTGRPTVLKVAKTGGLDFQDVRYLPAKTFKNAGEDDVVYGYEKETWFFIPFKTASSLKSKTITVPVTFQSQTCKDDRCIPIDLTIEAVVKITKTKQTLPKLDTLFLKAQPARGKGAITGIYETKKKNPAATTLQKFNIPELNSKTLDLAGTTNSTIKNLNTTSDLDSLQLKPVYSESTISGIIQALLFGFIAGLILNVMPCVLPVVSLKLMALVKQSEKSRKESALTGLAFSGGIILSFLFLAVLAAFFGYSWGGLFQNSTFLLIMTSIIFILALSMFGLFKISVPTVVGRAASGSLKNQYLDSFFKGLLATLLATPCSGPFLGGTLAWTLTQPPVIIIAIFLSIGVGMAFPYLLLAINPSFTRFIPKPGDWMVTMEKIMAFLLIFTTVYLLSIFKAELILPMITFLSFLALAAWLYGKYGSPVNSPRSRFAALMGAIFIGTAGYVISFDYLFQKTDVTVEKTHAYSFQKLMENNEKGKITIVKFTADWCPNCKLVETTSLYTSKVLTEVKKRDVSILIADITQTGTEGEKLLHKLGNKSIPFLAVFPSGKEFTSPFCMRDMYSEDDVLNALDRASKE